MAWVELGDDTGHTWSVKEVLLKVTEHRCAIRAPVGAFSDSQFAQRRTVGVGGDRRDPAEPWTRALALASCLFP